MGAEGAASPVTTAPVTTAPVTKAPAAKAGRPARPSAKAGAKKAASRTTAGSGLQRSARPTKAAARPGLSSEPKDAKVTTKLADAARAYSADRYQDALRMLRKLSSDAPDSAAVKELLGLTLYRLGRWPLALKELQEHHLMSGSYDQYPVIADCLRAMRRYAEADDIWAELRQASPSPEVVAEGRLVAAGALADRGELQAAVKLLEPSVRHSKPKGLHLRQWYALADLYERAGELPRARDLFLQIIASDPSAYDVRQRLGALG